jgi:hypothetical protein
MSACALVTLAVEMLQIDAVAAGSDPDPEIAPKTCGGAPAPRAWAKASRARWI